MADSTLDRELRRCRKRWMPNRRSWRVSSLRQRPSLMSRQRFTPDEVRNIAVQVIEWAEGVASLVESAAEAGLSAAEELPLVGRACKVCTKSIER